MHILHAKSVVHIKIKCKSSGFTNAIKVYFIRSSAKIKVLRAIVEKIEWTDA